MEVVLLKAPGLTGGSRKSWSALSNAVLPQESDISHVCKHAFNNATLWRSIGSSSYVLGVVDERGQGLRGLLIMHIGGNMSTARIEFVCSGDTFRGSGIRAMVGRKLLRAAETIAASEGCSKLSLTSVVPGHGIYLNSGYTFLNEDDYPDFSGPMVKRIK